jgi:glycine cleavage system H protein
MSQRIIEIDGIKFPVDLYYTDRHVWIRKEGNRVLVVGIDDLGQKLAGRISVITLIEEGHSVVPGKVFGVMESMKWVERLRSPVTGTIAEVNEGLMSRPQTVNENPYGLGWMVKINATSNLDRELLGLVFGESIKNWAMKETREKLKPAGK